VSYAVETEKNGVLRSTLKKTFCNALYKYQHFARIY